MKDPYDHSPAVEEFLSELRLLCRRHGLEVCPSGYDHLDVWRLNLDDEQAFRDINAARDMTEASSSVFEVAAPGGSVQVSIDPGTPQAEAIAKALTELARTA